MLLDFTGKTAVVTGGANGIGFAAAKAFADSGAEVWVLDLASEDPARAAARIGAKGLDADITDPGLLEEAFATIPRVNVLVANAGIGQPAPLTETTTELWDRTIAVNLSGLFHTVRIAARRMKEQQGGSIVLTASTNSYDGEADLVAYNASKAGVLGILHTAANELGPHRIRVNAVCPGLIRTRLTQRYFDTPEVLKPYFQHIALGRGGEPEEVAAAILFLASEAASFVSGAALLVDGGQMTAKYGVWTEENAHFVKDRWVLR